jgi:hypothetical protein
MMLARLARLARLSRSGDLTAVRVPGAGDTTSAGCCIDATASIARPQRPRRHN